MTGVPGAGKTLVGLNTATKHQDKGDSLYSVFLSGYGPLVAVLREALARDHMHTYVSSKLTDSEYGAGQVLKKINSCPNVTIDDALHLAVSMRSFRAENVSHLVKQLLDLELQDAKQTLDKLREKYPRGSKNTLRPARR